MATVGQKTPEDNGILVFHVFLASVLVTNFSLFFVLPLAQTEYRASGKTKKTEAEENKNTHTV